MQSRSINHTLQALIIATMLAFATLASAEPTIQEINQTLKNGDLAKADAQMKEVISAHPNSAKAHFKYSEILAAEGKIDAARAELSSAEKLKPNLDFAKPDAVKALNQKLYQTGQSHQGGGYSTTNLFITWAVVAFIVFFIVMIVRAIRRPSVQPNYATNPQMPNGYGPNGYGPQGYPQQGGGMGSGIVGGLATGAAVGAGIVAGEMLMHKVLDDDQPGNHDSYTRNQPAPDNYNDISGSDFVDNDNGSWDSDSSSDSDSSGGDWS